jgi:RNA polymerase sigma-70 factor (ECF subfamily)
LVSTRDGFIFTQINIFTNIFSNQQIGNKYSNRKKLKGDQTAFNLLLNLYWNEVLRLHVKTTRTKPHSRYYYWNVLSKAFDKKNSHFTTPNFSLTPGWLALQKCPYRLVWNQVFFVEITDKEDQKAYKYRGTIILAEDELITEQNLSQLLHHQRISTALSRGNSVALFPRMTYQEIANAIDEPLSNVAKLLQPKSCWPRSLDRR